MTSEPPPLPTLFDAKRGAARTREKATKRPVFVLRFGAKVPEPAPPDPEPQNPWRILPETLPVNAAIVRPYKPVAFVQNAVVTARSPFRKGSITFDADGVTLAGIGVNPVGWLGKVGNIGFFVWFIGMMTNAFGRGGGTLPAGVRWVAVAGFVVGLLGSSLENAVTEMRRVPMTIRLPWHDILEAQVESNSRWIVLMYRDAPKKEGTPGLVKHLPMSQITPAHAAALWDAFEAYAPGKIRANAATHDVNPRNIWLVLLFIGVIVGVVTLIAVLNSRP